MKRIVCLLFLLMFSAPGFAKMQPVEMCPENRPINGYVVCHSCDTPKVLQYHYPDDDMSWEEWGSLEAYEEHMKTYYKTAYKEKCVELCPDRIEFCLPEWLGEGDCFCGQDTLLFRLQAVSYNGVFGLFLGGLIFLLPLYLVFATKFFNKLGFVIKSQALRTMCSLVLAMLLFVGYGMMTLGSGLTEFTIVGLLCGVIGNICVSVIQKRKIRKPKK